MIFSSLFETAWHALATHRMRSFLTMLGMVIGVAAVILMMAIGAGARGTVLIVRSRIFCRCVLSARPTGWDFDGRSFLLTLEACVTQGRILTLQGPGSIL